MTTLPQNVKDGEWYEGEEISFRERSMKELHLERSTNPKKSFRRLCFKPSK